MGDGITISQEGIDVNEALDAQKVLDSRWRYFEIAFEQKVSIRADNPGPTPDTVVFEHNLGFLPAFTCYNITDDKYSGSGFSLTEVAGVYSTPTKIGFTVGGDFSGSIEALLRIYNVPILEEYEAPIVRTLPSKSIVPSRYGIKITDSGNFGQQELSKYTLNTKGKSLAIQKTGRVATVGGKATVTHNLGFPPSYLVTEILSGYIAPIDPEFIPALSEANKSTITFRGAQAALQGDFAYIIFKEPAEIAI